MAMNWMGGGRARAKRGGAEQAIMMRAGFERFRLTDALSAADKVLKRREPPTKPGCFVDAGLERHCRHGSRTRTPEAKRQTPASGTPQNVDRERRRPLEKRRPQKRHWNEEAVELAAAGPESIDSEWQRLIQGERRAAPLSRGTQKAIAKLQREAGSTKEAEAKRASLQQVAHRSRTPSPKRRLFTAAPGGAVDPTKDAHRRQWDGKARVPKAPAHIAPKTEPVETRCNQDRDRSQRSVALGPKARSSHETEAPLLALTWTGEDGLSRGESPERTLRPESRLSVGIDSALLQDNRHQESEKVSRARSPALSDDSCSGRAERYSLLRGFESRHAEGGRDGKRPGRVATPERLKRNHSPRQEPSNCGRSAQQFVESSRQVSQRSTREIGTQRASTDYQFDTSQRPRTLGSKKITSSARGEPSSARRRTKQSVGAQRTSSNNFAAEMKSASKRGSMPRQAAIPQPHRPSRVTQQRFTSDHPRIPVCGGYEKPSMNVTDAPSRHSVVASSKSRSISDHRLQEGFARKQAAEFVGLEASESCITLAQRDVVVDKSRRVARSRIGGSSDMTRARSAITGSGYLLSKTHPSSPCASAQQGTDPSDLYMSTSHGELAEAQAPQINSQPFECEMFPDVCNSKSGSPLVEQVHKWEKSLSLLEQDFSTFEALPTECSTMLGSDLIVDEHSNKNFLARDEDVLSTADVCRGRDLFESPVCNDPLCLEPWLSECQPANPFRVATASKLINDDLVVGKRQSATGFGSKAAMPAPKEEQTAAAILSGLLPKYPLPPDPVDNLVAAEELPATRLDSQGVEPPPVLDEEAPSGALSGLLASYPPPLEPHCSQDACCAFGQADAPMTEATQAGAAMVRSQDSISSSEHSEPSGGLARLMRVYSDKSDAHTCAGIRDG